MVETQKEFLTIGETQALLGASRNFVYRLIDKGLPKYKIGKRSYLKTEDIKNLFQKEELKKLGRPISRVQKSTHEQH